MIKLTKATIHKYKSIEQEQTFEIESDVTVFVGTNESGKTNLLEALAKVNYFEADKNFSFNMTRDYPRKEKKAADRLDEAPIAVTLSYQISKELINKISEDIKLPIKKDTFSYSKRHDNKAVCSIYEKIDIDKFVKKQLSDLGVKDEKYIKLLTEIKDEKGYDSMIAQLTADGEAAEFLEKLNQLKKYYVNKLNWDNPIEEYIWRTYLKRNMPKFMYYSDYYMLPSRISIDKLDKQGQLDESSEKTARALLELADINTKNIIDSDSYEDFKAELEATQAIISDEVFKYWSTNKNIRINFDIDKVEETDTNNNQRIVDHVLDIRVQNLRSMVTLPLENRSKGFNWFFSFIVWFKKIQEDKNNSYILLLDEPGLNLHAMAQHDLLQFIEDLSEEYQVLYTTHSPFMIESSKLNRVRTVVEEDDGTHVTDCLQTKNPDTLFPLQAALGYTLAQNLFVSDKNLLVEGISDLVYLNIFSNILNEMGKESLSDDVTIVPVGGADKIATFVSLLRGNELSMVCLLDTFTDDSSKARLTNLAEQNIIKDKKIIFYHDVLDSEYADIEDLFNIEDYLKIFNGAFKKKLKSSEIDESLPIVEQLVSKNAGRKFNHYTPSNYLAKNIQSISFEESTLNNFERLFVSINAAFK